MIIRFNTLGLILICLFLYSIARFLQGFIMPKLIDIQCSEKISIIITTAIRDYKDMAYPASSKSECNQAARESLETTVMQFESAYQEKGKGVLNRRMRAMVQAAIEQYYQQQAEQSGTKTDAQCALILKVCKGEPAEDADLDQAIQTDQNT